MLFILLKLPFLNILLYLWYVWNSASLSWNCKLKVSKALHQVIYSNSFVSLRGWGGGGSDGWFVCFRTWSLGRITLLLLFFMLRHRVSELSCSVLVGGTLVWTKDPFILFSLSCSLKKHHPEHCIQKYQHVPFKHSMTVVCDFTLLLFSR